MSDIGRVLQLATLLSGLILSWYSIVKALKQYKTSVQHRAAESLMHLEERFERLTKITRLIDPESQRFGRDLAPAVQMSLDGRQLDRSEEQNDQIAQLDQFLRFLLLTSRLETNRLVDLETLKYMYHYWYGAVLKERLLEEYVARYFKNLYAFLDKNRKEFLQEADLGRSSPAEIGTF